MINKEDEHRENKESKFKNAIKTKNMKRRVTETSKIDGSGNENFREGGDFKFGKKLRKQKNQNNVKIGQKKIIKRDH